ncbi:MAG: YggS family pyridoxal phosphate-dependent enzyme [Vicinamibacterales bacterium]
MSSRSAVAENLESVRRRLDAAARRARRDPASVTLVAVSKTFPADRVREAVEAGQRVFGENKVQEGADKARTLAADGHDDLRWHLIGHLQSNKAKKAAEAFSCVETVDSVALAGRLGAAAAAAGRRIQVFVQADLAGEATKSGAPEADVPAVARAVLDQPALDLRGLMILPPFPDDPEDSRPWFRRLRELRDRLVANGLPADHLADLSMGMSHDFEVAIEEGATLVRVGTAIFGRRTPPAAAP